MNGDSTEGNVYRLFNWTLSCKKLLFARGLHSERRLMPMVQLLRAVLANTVGRLLADLVRRLFD